MTPEQFLPLNEIKKKCGLPVGATDLDVQLGIYRDAAISKIESRTRRHIVDVENLAVRSASRGDGMSFIVFHVHDAKAISSAKAITYRTDQTDPGFARDGTLAIPASLWDVRADSVCVYNGDSSGVQNWPRRDMKIPYEATFDVGIPEGNAPAEFQAAALMLVRELQEGSAMDSLPSGILDLILRDHVKPRLTAADAERADAGVD